MLKQDKMASCGTPGYINPAKKNSNIIALITYNHGIFRTLSSLIPEAYSKPCQIFKTMRDIENPDKLSTVYSSMFRHIHGHSAIFSHGQVYWGTLKHMVLIQMLPRYIELYSEIFRTLCNPCIYNRAIFRTLSRNLRHLQKPVKNVRWSSIFRALS